MSEKLNISGVEISNPDKIVYPTDSIRKIDVINYYDKVSQKMMPYVENRLLSVIRCPKGVGTCFYNKHQKIETEGTENLPVKNSEGKSEDYFYIDDKIGLVSEAQMGTVEYHIWGSRIEKLEKPDMMVFDLDPNEGMDEERVRVGARDLKQILDRLDLASFIKTSGGKGYHIVVPFKASKGWDSFHDFAKKIAEVMEQEWPTRYTSNVRKSAREDKIFIDWIRNGRGATSVAPYSLRAREGAPVSMPISWDELDFILPNQIKMQDAITRLEAPDPWKGFYETEQVLQ